MGDTRLAMPDVERFEPRFDQGDMTDEEIARVLDYFRRFAATIEFAEGIEPGSSTREFEVKCPKCGATIYGGMGALHQAIGLYSFQWGLVHGEGYCGGKMFADEACGWPVCGYPRVELGPDRVVTFPVPLAYHPDEVTSKEDTDG